MGWAREEGPAAIAGPAGSPGVAHTDLAAPHAVDRAAVGPVQAAVDVQGAHVHVGAELEHAARALGRRTAVEGVVRDGEVRIAVELADHADRAVRRPAAVGRLE